ncbi:peptide deformylase [Leptolyngbya sp. FACHB-261]|uniref:peptide deformylase n=1 Tax=Leptolyngbya sp. FACHB-261 TaxID=2692806 RepID=UPI001686B31C|nr:peptide deformylase [Leptolyngbya sp. FACHB-261]MBD2104243.1 peptide deformylase [Leptolyngbya sp. FACHB-261]
MAVLTIAQIGESILRQVATPFLEEELQISETQQLIDDMTDTLRDSKGVGLAAPQVFVSKRLLVMESVNNPRYPDAPDIPLTVLVNPEISWASSERDAYQEGCLSVPLKRGEIWRPTQIQLKAWNRFGEILNLELDGFPARVIQHEIDHLNGILIPDRTTEQQTELVEVR